MPAGAAVISKQRLSCVLQLRCLLLDSLCSRHMALASLGGLERSQALSLPFPPSLADSKGLSNPAEVEALREKVYASLEAYCKQKYPEQPGR